MRLLLLAGCLLLALGAGALHFQGTFAEIHEQEHAGASFTAETQRDGVRDPGHAYEDVDNDGRFAEGQDIALPDRDIRDGHHVTSQPGHGLVVPKSVGGIELQQGAIDLQAGSQGHLIVEVKLAAPDGISLWAGTDADLGNLLAETEGPFEVHAGHRLGLQGLRSEADQRITIVSQDGAVVLGSATLETQGTIHVDAGARLFAEDARFETEGDIGLSAGGNVYIKRASLETASDASITAGSQQDAVFVEGARFEDANETAKAGPAGVEIVGTPAAGDISYTG